MLARVDFLNTGKNLMATATDETYTESADKGRTAWGH
jgi:hypothetical protein